jgi:uncharacterized protein with GYD domain
MQPGQNIFVVLIAFLATLGCYTTIAIIGVPGDSVLPEVLLAIGGGLTGVAIGGGMGGIAGRGR